MGTSPIATYIESAAGIREGGRTGITALTCAFYFFIALFFVPVLCESPALGFAPSPAAIKQPDFSRSLGHTALEISGVIQTHTHPPKRVVRHWQLSVVSGGLHC